MLPPAKTRGEVQFRASIMETCIVKTKQMLKEHVRQCKNKKCDICYIARNKATHTTHTMNAETCTGGERKPVCGA